MDRQRIGDYKAPLLGNSLLENSDEFELSARSPRGHKVGHTRQVRLIKTTDTVSDSGKLKLSHYNTLRDSGELELEPYHLSMEPLQTMQPIPEDESFDEKNTREDQMTEEQVFEQFVAADERDDLAQAECKRFIERVQTPQVKEGLLQLLHELNEKREATAPEKPSSRRSVREREKECARVCVLERGSVCVLTWKADGVRGGSYGIQFAFAFVVLVRGSLNVFLTMAAQQYPTQSLYMLRSPITIGTFLPVILYKYSSDQQYASNLTEAFSDAATYRKVFIFALLQTVIPFNCLSYSLQYIEAGVGSVLMACLPLVTVLIKQIPAIKALEKNPKPLSAVNIAGMSVGLFGVMLW